MLTLYKASAGSGKTYSLARKYLLLLLGTKNRDTGKYTLNRIPGKNARTILAVTFTNKATEEMKKRIITELSMLAFSPAESEHFEYLKKELGVVNNPEALVEAARKELYALLFDFSSLSISTIDSFFQQVLRSFASEINRPGNFEIELDSRLAVYESTDTMLNELSRPEIFRGTNQVETLTRWLMQFIRTQIEEGNSFNIFNRDGSVMENVVSTVTALMNEQFSLHRDKLNVFFDNPEKLDEFRKELVARRKQLVNELRGRAASLLAAGTDEGGGEYSDIGCKLKEEWLRTCAESGDFSQKLPACAAENRPIDQHFNVKVKVTASPSFRTALSDFYDFYNQGIILSKTIKEILSRLFYMGILGPITKILRHRSVSGNTILIQNTTDLLNRIIGDNLSPFIYDKVGTRLNHFLIDEFQDTSEMQWRNFRPLVVDSLAVNNDNLIIGDEKQCIYRFRNSAPELLGTKVAAELTSVLRNPGIIAEEGKKLAENTNYRSAADIIRFNNTLFACFSTLPNLDTLVPYRNVIQDIPGKKKDYRGHVRVEFLDKDSEKNGDGQEQDTDTEALGIMKKEVARLLTRYRPQDIAVLTRTNSEAANVMTALLDAMEEGTLPVFNIVSGESLRLGESKCVKMILDILRIADSPSSVAGNADFKERKYKSLRADLARLILHFNYRISNGDSPEDALAMSAAPETEAVPSTLDMAIRNQTFDLTGTIERVIAELPEKERVRDAIFIAGFQDAVLTYMEKGSGDIHSFLEWWDRTGYKTTVDSPPGTDALTISTIHKSKGIEYPAVILPFVNWKFTKDSSVFQRDVRWYDTSCLLPLGISEEIVPPLLPLEKRSALATTLFSSEYSLQNNEQRSDNLNLTYVAFTRAKEELSLVVSGAPGAKDSIYSYIRDAIDAYPVLMAEIAADNRDELLPLVTDIGAGYDEDKKIIELGKTRETSYEEDIKRKEEEKLAGLSPEEKEKEFAKRQAETPAPMPVIHTVKRREALRLGKIDSSEEYNPDKTRLKAKFGLTKLGTPEQFLDENMRVIGDFLHAVMSRVYSAGDLDYALDVESEKVLLPDELREKYRTLLSDAINNPEIADWFAPENSVMTERTLSYEAFDRETGKKVLKTCRPDRIVRRNDGSVIVIDYKFGLLKSNDYSWQVSGYLRHLRQSGIPDAKGYLWYINLNKIVEIDARQQTLF